MLLLALVAITGCSQVIAPGSTRITVGFTRDGCRPLSWRVPAGETITLEMNNQADQDYTWTLMSRPVTLPLDANDAANIYFATQVSPGKSATGQLTAPNAPGDYDVVCSPLAHTEDDQVGKVTVVKQ